MVFHDPRREVEKLRDHLASHDAPIAFLIGAGASCAVRSAGSPLIPTTTDLGTLCSEAAASLGPQHSAAFRAVADEVEESRPGGAADIEEILSHVRRKIAAMTESDELAGVDREHLVAVERSIRKTIAQAATPEETRIPSRLPHHALAQWISRIPRSHAVELFTTNYDTLLERGLEDERVPIFDGFVGSRDPFFSAASLAYEDAAPGRRWTRLWKIHGSVNWRWRTMPDGGQRIVRAEENLDGELILPSFHKYDESRRQPYVAILDRLTRVLTGREDALLIAVGYGFRDEHINEVLYDSLDIQSRTHIVALQFEDFAEDSELAKRAVSNQNLLVYGPTRAMVAGVAGDWQLLEEVDARTAGLLDVPFDSVANPEPEETALTGRFRLGDFRWVARFLEDIAGSR